MLNEGHWAYDVDSPEAPRTPEKNPAITPLSRPTATERRKPSSTLRPPSNQPLLPPPPLTSAGHLPISSSQVGKAGAFLPPRLPISLVGCCTNGGEGRGGQEAWRGERAVTEVGLVFSCGGGGGAAVFEEADECEGELPLLADHPCRVVPVQAPPRLRPPQQCLRRHGPLRFGQEIVVGRWPVGSSYRMKNQELSPLGLSDFLFFFIFIFWRVSPSR